MSINFGRSTQVSGSMRRCSARSSTRNGTTVFFVRPSLEPQAFEVIPGPAPYLNCLDHQIEQGTFYQPADRYWGLQWRESLLLVVTAAALLGATVLSVRRRKA